MSSSCWFRILSDARAEQLARELLIAVEQPMLIDDIVIHPSASIGISLAKADGDSLSLLART